MNTRTRRLHSFNLVSDTHRRRVGECQAGAARLWGAEGANHALKTAYWTLAVVLALSSSWVHAQTPTCVAPGCNPVASDGASNTAVGSGALTHLTTGGQIHRLGDELRFLTTRSAATIPPRESKRFFSNTIGGQNTALGVYALASNTEGGNNTALGMAALVRNTTGYANTASGESALNINGTGNENTASGFEALFSNTTGNNNVAVGAYALYSNTTVSGNTASGSRALFSNATGASNAAFGASALEFNVEGNENTASGAFSLYFNTSGNYNSASGFQALYANTTASRNTALRIPSTLFHDDRSAQYRYWLPCSDIQCHWAGQHWNWK